MTVMTTEKRDQDITALTVGARVQNMAGKVFILDEFIPRGTGGGRACWMIKPETGGRRQRLYQTDITNRGWTLVTETPKPAERVYAVTQSLTTKHIVSSSGAGRTLCGSAVRHTAPASACPNMIADLPMCRRCATAEAPAATTTPAAPKGPGIIGQRRAAWTGPRANDEGTIARVAGIGHVIVKWDSDDVETWYRTSDLHWPERLR